MLPLVLLITFAAPTAFATSQWRWAIFSLGVAFIFLSIGLAALTVFFFRRRTAGNLPLYFGIFVILYGLRMIAREPVLLPIFDLSPSVSNHIVRVITYTIALPALFLFVQVVEKRWKTLFLWVLYIHVAFSVVALIGEAFAFAPVAIDRTNSILVLTFWLLWLAFLFFFRTVSGASLPKELRVVRIGFAILGLFVIHANLSGLGLVPGRDLEPIGFLAFVCSLGYLVAYRIFAKEESLFAIQKELQIAEQIQTSILPRDVPRLVGLEIAARYLPMSAVAGDFYDFLVAGDSQIGILVADVTGHGVPAALIASMLKVAFASQSAHLNDPARVLTGLNQALCGKFEDHFVTAAYLFADLNAKTIRYAGAGHPPLLLKNRASAVARSIEQNGLFLGMFPEAEYSSVEMRMNPGDRYVLYTDGLPESKSLASEEFGISRCMKILDSGAQLSATSLADQLLGDISKWTSQGTARFQDDDMTLLVLDFTGAS